MPEFFNYRDRAVKGTAAAIDAAHNLFVLCWWLMGNDAGIEINQYNAAGAFVRTFHLDPPLSSAGHPLKPDAVTLLQSGPDLLVIPGGHEAITDPARQNPVWGMIVPGVCVPYADGRNPLGGSYPADAFRSIGGGDPPPATGPVDLTPAALAAIERLIAAHVDGLAAQFGGSSVRAGIQEKVMDALVALLTAPDSDPRAKPWRDHMAQFSRDRSFEAATEALRKAGWPPLP